MSGTHLRGPVFEALAVGAVGGAALVVLEIGAVAGYRGQVVLSLLKDDHALLLAVRAGIVYRGRHEHGREVLGFHHGDARHRDHGRALGDGHAVLLALRILHVVLTEAEVHWDSLQDLHSVLASTQSALGFTGAETVSVCSDPGRDRIRMHLHSKTLIQRSWRAAILLNREGKKG